MLVSKILVSKSLLVPQNFGPKKDWVMNKFLGEQNIHVMKKCAQEVFGKQISLSLKFSLNQIIFAKKFFLVQIQFFGQKMFE